MILQIASFLFFQTAFAQDFAQLPDLDRDGIEDQRDACPNIPGNDKIGCPDIDIFLGNSAHDIQLFLADKENAYFIEKDEIRIGDKFSAGFLDTATREIYGESDQYEVTR